MLYRIQCCPFFLLSLPSFVLLILSCNRYAGDVCGDKQVVEGPELDVELWNSLRLTLTALTRADIRGNFFVSSFYSCSLICFDVANAALGEETLEMIRESSRTSAVAGK